MYPGVELRLLRYVAALAEELNFTRASARLRVAQPSLSKQIRDLEDSLGLKLFERTKREVRLTSAGEAFTAEARQAILHAERAVDLARTSNRQHKGPWTIGYSPLIDLRILSRIKHHLCKLHPSAEVRFASAYTSEQTRKLLNGAIQSGLVILPLQEPGLTSQRLYRETLLLALACHHPLVAKAEIETPDLHELPLVTMRSDFEPRFGEHVERVFRAARIRCRVVHRATTQSDALQFASHNGLAALLMASAQNFVHEGIVFRRFADDFLSAETGLVYCAERESPILASLRTFLIDTFLPLASGNRVSDRPEGQLGLFSSTALPFTRLQSTSVDVA